MPELPEVETVCRGLARVLEGRVIDRVVLRRADLRTPFPPGFADRIAGRRVVSIRRRAKFMLMALDDGTVVIGHLGMSGRMVIGPPRLNVLDRHDHVVFETAEASVRFNDPRRFGLMTLTAEDVLSEHPLLARLGPEPLDDSFTGPALAAALRGKNGPLKTVLLDQRVVAGLGNIYVSEALFRAGLSPRRAARTVTGGRADRLVRAIKDVLSEAIAAGGSTLRDHVQPTGELGYFQHRFAVYDREGQPCPGCDCDPSATGGIRRIVQAGRSTFFCPKRQR